MTQRGDRRHRGQAATRGPVKDNRGGRRAGAGRPAGPSKETLAKLAVIEASRDLSAAVVIEQIRRGACFDARKLFTSDGAYIPIHQLSEADAAMVAGFEFVTGNIDKGDGKLDRIVKVRLVDRRGYVEMAAKYHGLLIERVKVEDDRPLRQKVAAARARLAAAKAARV